MVGIAYLSIYLSIYLYPAHAILLIVKASHKINLYYESLLNPS